MTDKKSVHHIRLLLFLAIVLSFDRTQALSLSLPCTLGFSNIGKLFQKRAAVGNGLTLFERAAAAEAPDEIVDVAITKRFGKAHNNRSKKQGDGYFEVAEGTYQDRNVFIKYTRAIDQTSEGRGSDSALAEFEKELKWTKIFSYLGIGPKYIGLDIHPNGNLGIVTEFVPGRHVQSGLDIQAMVQGGFRFTKKHVEDLKRIQKLFRQYGILVSDSEFQLRISENGIKVVDAELYRDAAAPYEVLSNSGRNKLKMYIDVIEYCAKNPFDLTCAD